MSGLVFVRDAQSRPLMPTSAAYARTLLYKRKAKRISHPALNIIQLTSVVPEPVLRPVVINIFLHHQTAYLTLLTEHRRGTISSLSMIVDLTISKHVHQSWRTRSHRRQPSAPFESLPVLRQQVLKLTTLFATLQAIIPISHLNVLSGSPTNKASLRITRWIQAYLRRGLVPLNASITFVGPVDLQATLSPELSQAVHRVGSVMENQLPDLVAYFFEAPRLQRGLPPYVRVKDVAQQSDKRVTNQNQLLSGIQPGQVCTFWYLGRKRTGFISAIQQDVLIVRIAVTTTLQGVHWRKVRLRAPQVRDLWPTSPVLLLPLAHLATT